jgi:hypothetical protein
MHGTEARPDRTGGGHVPEPERPARRSVPSQGVPEGSQEPANTAARPRAPAGGSGAFEGSEEPRRRSWWREFFGFGQ